MTTNYLLEQTTIDDLERLISDSPSDPISTPNDFEEKITKIEKCKGNFSKHVYQSLFEKGDGDWKVWDGSFYRYTCQGYWVRVEATEVKKLILDFAANVTNDQGKVIYESTKHSNDAYDFCRLKLLVSKQDSNRRLICFKNGTLNVSTMKLLPHSKEHYLTHHLDANYTKNNSCPDVIRNFLTCSTVRT